MTMVVTEFARGRLFDPQRSGKGIVGCSLEDFEGELNRRRPLKILDGYAPFCKLHIHGNWTQTPVDALRITPENEGRLRSAYEARTPEELPVLVRWFEGIEAPVAEYLCVILYDREQLLREGEQIEAEWGVVGVLATMEPKPTPMVPITMMRNALGVAEGGSGVSLDRASYLESVAYWQDHANLRHLSTERQDHD